jgi:hypothetical protein
MNANTLYFGDIKIASTATDDGTETRVRFGNSRMEQQWSASGHEPNPAALRDAIAHELHGALEELFSTTVGDIMASIEPHELDVAYGVAPLMLTADSDLLGQGGHWFACLRYDMVPSEVVQRFAPYSEVPPISDVIRPDTHATTGKPLGQSVRVFVAVPGTERYVWRRFPTLNDGRCHYVLPESYIGRFLAYAGACALLARNNGEGADADLRQQTRDGQPDALFPRMYSLSRATRHATMAFGVQDDVDVKERLRHRVLMHVLVASGLAELTAQSTFEAASARLTPLGLQCALSCGALSMSGLAHLADFLRSDA